MYKWSIWGCHCCFKKKPQRQQQKNSTRLNAGLPVWNSLMLTELCIDTVAPMVNKEEAEAEYIFRYHKCSQATKLVLHLGLNFWVEVVAPIANCAAFLTAEESCLALFAGRHFVWEGRSKVLLSSIFYHLLDKPGSTWGGLARAGVPCSSPKALSSAIPHIPWPSHNGLCRGMTSTKPFHQQLFIYIHRRHPVTTGCISQVCLNNACLEI